MNPSDGYIAYIVNPKSGASSANRMVTEFKGYLLENGFDVRTMFTQSLTHAGELSTKAAVDYNCKIVVVAGGDGTVREVAHGLEGTEKPLLTIPCGTENLIANELGFDEKTKTLIKAFEAGCTRTFDLGRANGKCFAAITGFGFDGDVVKRVSQLRSGHINHLDYFWPIWRTFWTHEFPHINVVVDEKEVFDGIGLVFVGNISRYAVGIEILHYADFSDGLLDVCIYKCASRLHLVKHSLMTIIKHHADRKDVIYRQGKTIEITSDSEDISTQIDGDPGSDLPLKIEIIPQAVKVTVPPNAKPAGMITRLIRILG